MTGTEQAALLALDWGTSSLRAYLMDTNGNVIDVRHSDQGIQFLPEPAPAGFETAFRNIAGDWLHIPHLPVVASGMVGSAQGWLEAPYINCPADTDLLAERSARLELADGTRIMIVPGVCFDQPGQMPDVIRGEETQIAGVLEMRPDLLRGDALMVMPGTHSKWVRVEKGRIIRFSTHMTGEIFSLLRRQSILGRLMKQGADTEETKSFSLGLELARKAGPGDLTRQLFSVRTMGLLGRIEPGSLSAYLSGIMIGHELVSGMADHGRPAGVPLLLIGDGKLCRRYERAFADFGVTGAELVENPAPRGMTRIAAKIGLLKNPVPVLENKPGNRRRLSACASPR